MRLERPKPLPSIILIDREGLLGSSDRWWSLVRTRYVGSPTFLHDPITLRQLKKFGRRLAAQNVRQPKRRLAKARIVVFHQHNHMQFRRVPLFVSDYHGLFVVELAGGN